MHSFLPSIIFQAFLSCLGLDFLEKNQPPKPTTPILAALSLLITSILAKHRNWACNSSFKDRCWIFRTRASNNLSKPHVFINMLCFWLSMLVVFSMAHQHFMVLSNPSTAQDSWSVGLLQILYLTPIQSHRKLSTTLEKKKTQTVHIITQLLTFTPWNLLLVCMLQKTASPHILGIPELIKAIHLPSSLCLLVFITMGLVKVSYSNNRWLFRSIHPGNM